MLGILVAGLAICWAAGLVEFTYPNVVPNEPLSLSVLSKQSQVGRTHRKPLAFGIYVSTNSQRVQRTGANRLAQRRIQSHRRLAPVADLMRYAVVVGR